MKIFENASCCFFVIICIILISCNQKTGKETAINNFSENPCVFIIYNQPINGYDVQVTVENPTSINDLLVGTGLMQLKKGKDTFNIVHGAFFLPDSILNSPQKNNLVIDYNYENGSSTDDFSPFKWDMPFFFADVNFDNHKDLILNYKALGQRHGSIYQVYLNYGDSLNCEPLIEKPFCDFDDFTRFDYKNKEIIIHLSGGVYCWEDYFYKRDTNNEFSLYKIEDINTDGYYIVFSEYKIEKGKKRKISEKREEKIIEEAKQAGRGINIIETPDKKYKFYSFDDGDNGTMRHYKTYIQYKNDSGETVFLQWQDKVQDSHLYENIWQFKYKDTAYYVAKTFKQGSNCSWGYGMEIFTLKNGIPTYHTKFYPKGIYEPHEHKILDFDSEELEYYLPAYDVAVCYTGFCHYDIDYMFNPKTYTVSITEYDESQPDKEMQKKVKRSWKLIMPK